jgi:hypothetical protein
MKPLPLGRQSFETLILDHNLYVDRTEDMFNMLQSGKYLFLSRPRRFGKSLLVSTLKALFEGKQHLFKGLWIYDKWAWEAFPVIHVDFTVLGHSNPEELKNSLDVFLQAEANAYEVRLSKGGHQTQFAHLLKDIHEKTGKPIAILIDEYDKPITDLIDKPDLADANREVLRSFFSALKGSDSHLRQLFITGVSKFAKVSIFSELNNLTDLTLKAAQNNIVGFREEEIRVFFAEYLAPIASKMEISQDDLMTQIRLWYNGYGWTGVETMYNPWSLLHFLSEGIFKQYWFESGSPTFLIKLIWQQERPATDFISVQASESVLNSFDIRNLNIVALLFQTGYLTVTGSKSTLAGQIYTLNFPNNEVRLAFFYQLLPAFLDKTLGDVEPDVIPLTETLEAENLDGFLLHLRRVFAKIPYTLHIEEEKYYHSLFYMLLTVLGAKINLETLTIEGQMDASLELGNLIYVVEFKYGKPEGKTASAKSLASSALRQIEKKNYAEAFVGLGKKIVLLGVGFWDKKIEYRVKAYKVT